MDHTASRRIDLLLARYAESHRHPANERIHCVCVPAIMFSLLGLCWHASPWLATGLVAAALAYYLSLSARMALGMLSLAAAMLLVLALLPAALVLPVSAAVFVLAWIGQFVGHHIEGRKPSFLQDLRFLLIGPLFVLGVWYRYWDVSY